MKKISTGLLMVLAATSVGACGKKEKTVTSVRYQSCVVPNNTAGLNMDFCTETQNSSDVRSNCDEFSGTFAETQCAVSTGVKGCQFTNPNGVPITFWYHGADWTSDSAKAACEKASGTLITK
jgi:hypothetical protein